MGDEAPASASPDSDPAEPLRRRPRRRRRTRRSSSRPGGSATLPPQGFPRSRLRSRWRFAATRTCVGRAQSVAIPPLATPERAHPGARESAADHRRGPRGTPRGTCHRRACARPYPAVACPGRAQPLGHRCRTGGRGKLRSSRDHQLLAQRLTSPMEPSLDGPLRHVQRARNLRHGHLSQIVGQDDGAFGLRQARDRSPQPLALLGLDDLLVWSLCARRRRRRRKRIVPRPTGRHVAPLRRAKVIGHAPQRQGVDPGGEPGRSLIARQRTKRVQQDLLRHVVAVGPRNAATPTNGYTSDPKRSTNERWASSSPRPQRRARSRSPSWHRPPPGSGASAIARSRRRGARLQVIHIGAVHLLFHDLLLLPLVPAGHEPMTHARDAQGGHDHPPHTVTRREAEQKSDANGQTRERGLERMARALRWLGRLRLSLGKRHPLFDGRDTLAADRLHMSDGRTGLDVPASDQHGEHSERNHESSVQASPPIRGEVCMPLWYVSDLARIWFSAQALTVGLPSIRWGIGVALYLICT